MGVPDSSHRYASDGGRRAGLGATGAVVPNLQQQWRYAKYLQVVGVRLLSQMSFVDLTTMPRKEARALVLKMHKDAASASRDNSTTRDAEVVVLQLATVYKQTHVQRLAPKPTGPSTRMRTAGKTSKDILAARTSINQWKSLILNPKKLMDQGDDHILDLQLVTAIIRGAFGVRQTIECISVITHRALELYLMPR